MEPKGLFAALVLLILIGSTVKNLLGILRLTKNIVVRGGEITGAVETFATIISLCGLLLLVYMFVFQSGYLAKVAIFIFGGQ